MKRGVIVESIERKDESVLFLYLIFFHFILFQILSILRAAAIYNTSYLAVYSSLLISLVIVVLFLTKLKKIKFNYFEILLILIPMIHFLFGVIINDSYRDLIADTYNAVFFGLLITYVRSQKARFDKDLQIKFANWMFWGLAISTFTYLISPLVGITVYSVGSTSIFFIFPLIVFFITKQKIKLILTLLLLLLASKRGVLLSVLAVFLVYGLINSNIKAYIRFGIITSVLITASAVIYFTISPDRINLLPQQFQPLMYKTMFINPLSEYNRFESDSRVREIVYIFQPILENPSFILSGMGPGYTYEYYDANGYLLEEERHNAHFTPATIFTRYGLFYTIFLYLYIFIIIIQNLVKLKNGSLSSEKTILLFYSIASLVNTLTSYTIYLDYLLVFSIGVLSINNKDLNNKKEFLRNYKKFNYKKKGEIKYESR